MNNPFCGWLSPDGKLYSCGRREHRDKAWEIFEELYPDEYVSSAYTRIEELGWLWIGEDSQIGGDWQKMSEKQAEFLMLNIKKADVAFEKAVIDSCRLGGHIDWETYKDMHRKLEAHP